MSSKSPVYRKPPEILDQRTKIRFAQYKMFWKSGQGLRVRVG